MKKNQQFYIMKFSSSRLKKSRYEINLSFDDARINGEIITINNSELLRTLFKYKRTEFSQKEFDILWNLRRKTKKLPDNEENRKKIEELTQRIEKIIYVEDLVVIEFKHKSHYLEIVKRNGFYVNGTRYVPFMASAGMIRKNTALFINNNLKHPIMDILENGRKEDVPMASAKFGAYFSLYASSTIPVSFPRFAVIPDKTIETIRRVDFVEYRGIGIDDSVTEKDYSMQCNAWDGQGLISPKLAVQWSNELELDYTLSSIIIRAPYLKGLAVVFDLNKFASEIAHTWTFTDIYGNTVDIRDVDLIVSESMFKLWNCYESTASYIENCLRNHLGFSVAKVNPKQDASYSRCSYQFLQVLKLNQAQIAELCEPTVRWFRDISGGNADNMILYAMGEKSLDTGDFRKLDTTIKGLLLNPGLAQDRYIQERFRRTLEKKMKESFMGGILVNANYQFMISDPFYQACHLFKLDRAPLLKDGEHYSEYWTERGVEQVGAIRSPIVHHSEFGILNLQNRPDTREWYAHIHSGIIFPASGVGIDCAIHGGADFDGDLICTINNRTMMNGRIPANPIIYESKKAEKAIVDSRDDKTQVEGQLRGHNSKVGFATNISSSIYAMLEEFKKGSPERQALEQRLKIGRAIQGEIIDGVKGLKVPLFREHWTKYKNPDDAKTEEERQRIEFHNRILCTVRPVFFRFLYPHYMTRYNEEIRRYDIYSWFHFGMSFSDLMKKPKRNECEEETVQSYIQNSYFLDNNSVMNTISRYMRMSIALIGRFSNRQARDFNYSVLLTPGLDLNNYLLLKMKGVLRAYKEFRRGIHTDLRNSYENMDAFISFLRKSCFSEISSNEAELASYAVEVTYGGEVSATDFVWKMFPEGILQNVYQNSNGTARIPVRTAKNDGEFEYLWSSYRMEDVHLEMLDVL